MSQVLEPVEAGREAVRRHSWGEAYELLAAADRESGLDAPDLEVLAEAAYWSGRLDEALAARERAHRRYLRDGNRPRAAALALLLSLDYIGKGDYPLFNGWFATGERLLADEPPAAEHALLELVRSLERVFTGRAAESLHHAERAYELATQFGDRDVQTLALVAQGSGLMQQGELDRGLRLLDEATTTALGAELSPLSSCTTYCITITSCREVGDIERARRWTHAANRWCDARDLGGFSGACRVHRSEILRLGGDWESAEQEALKACGELAGYDLFTRAAGYNEIGEIRRRRGEFAAAEEAFRTADDLGREPQPGLALLRLAQGRLGEAVSGLRRSLGNEKNGPLDRGRLLPAQVEVSLAAGDVDAARSAVAELEEIADAFRVDGKRTPLFEGNLHLGHGQIELAVGEWEAAERCLRRAVGTWSSLGAPYETARTRLLLGAVYGHLGDRDGAREQYEAAKATFERLGAVLDAQRAMEPLGHAEARRTFLFTDIVDSTKLLDALGDAKWSRLLDRHDRILGDAIEQARGEVIKHTGDGFFAAFDTPAAAVDAAVAIQRALEDEFVSVRIGVHSGEALERGDDYAGRGVNVAARIGAAAGAGEILVSSESLAEGEHPFRLSEPHTAELRGFDEPVELAAIDWRYAG
jgi:class 3 adenylate cyclase